MLLAIMLKQLSTRKPVSTKKPRTMRKMRGLRRLTPESNPKMQLKPTLKSMAKNRIHGERVKRAANRSLFLRHPITGTRRPIVTSAERRISDSDRCENVAVKPASRRAQRATGSSTIDRQIPQHRQGALA